MTYKIATGWNNAGSLNDVVPQPRSLGIVAGRRTQGGDRVIYEDGFRSVKWQWGFMSTAQWSSFLTTAGLGDGTPSAKVTISTPRNYDRAFTNYNAVIVMPNLPDDTRFEMSVFQDIAVMLQSLEEI